MRSKLLRIFYLLLLLLQLSLISSSIVLKDFNISQIKGLEPRIINGQRVSIGQFPWQVAIFTKLGVNWLSCGGSLISDEWILTAAHCTPENNIIGAVVCMIQAILSFNINVNCIKPRFVVLLGTIDIEQYDPGTLILQTDKYIKHPHYYSWTYLMNDVSLIKLNSKITFTDTIKPIALSSRDNFLGGGVDVVVSGWGMRWRGDLDNPYLYYTNLRTIPNLICSPFFLWLLPEGVLCAVSPLWHFQSACYGDSGSSLVVYDEQSNPVHVGVVSFGSTLGCQLGLPNGFARTTFYRNWIRDKTGI